MLVAVSQSCRMIGWFWVSVLLTAPSPLASASGPLCRAACAGARPMTSTINVAEKMAKTIRFMLSPRIQRQRGLGPHSDYSHPKTAVAAREDPRHDPQFPPAVGLGRWPRVVEVDGIPHR